MQLLYAVLHSPPWLSISDPTMDDSLRRHGFLPFADIRWEEYHYLDDGLHFTPTSESSFLDDLKRRVHNLSFPLLILSDSTFSHNGSDAAQRFESMFPPDGVVVDAVSGSGFLQLGRQGLNFTSRLRHHPLHRFRTVLVIGGWNDHGHTALRFDSAVEGFAHASAGRTRS